MTSGSDNKSGTTDFRKRMRALVLDSSSSEQVGRRRPSAIISRIKSVGKRKRSTDSESKVVVMTDHKDGEVDLAATFAAAFDKSASARAEYEKLRDSLLNTEISKRWDAAARREASPKEKRAAKILLKIKEHERDHLFGNLASEAIPGPETRDMGGQFLTNRERIVSQSLVFKIAEAMPKGGHLHLHFNSEIPPQALVDKARDMPNMYIRSTQPLLSRQSLLTTEVVFNVLPSDTEPANLFSPDYKPEFKAHGCKPWMLWSEFCKAFRAYWPDKDPEQWVQTKMILSEDEVYGLDQTVNGVWARFNQGTRAFKGLLNYESIFRWYIGASIDSMIKEKCMYAELRPMLLDKSIPSDDGKNKITHELQMDIILEEMEKKKKQLEAEGRLDEFPFGLRIIYCTPRSIPKKMMEKELQDCLKLKLKYPHLICGFDLVGAEDRPNHIGFYRDELLAFVEACKELKVEIPFLFHAGESLLDCGGSRDTANSNLYDAVALNAKRIGHGFSLVKHPDLIDIFRKRPICIELCPTSNELLHLCRNIKEHPYPVLLALGIPCTVNADNPALYRSSLTLEFYQVMVGSTTMNLHGWRQLAQWSIDHSCLTSEEIKEGREILARHWDVYCDWIIEQYGEYADGLDIEVPEI